MAWQPIETAPKGEEVVLWVPATPVGYIILGSYVDFGRKAPKGYHSGWYDSFIGHTEFHPTHWMPLPDPPAS